MTSPWSGTACGTAWAPHGQKRHRMGGGPPGYPPIPKGAVQCPPLEGGHAVPVALWARSLPLGYAVRTGSKKAVPAVVKYGG